ncbi:MAG: hypothetical protein K6G90_09560 [Clostridia bacterium]|nr:hypothetical protein [Clostridia bacterium]
MDRIEELLNKPCWIIDILPARVPENGLGRYFAVEDYFLKEQLEEIKRKHINVILKLNCYADVEIDGRVNPLPDEIARAMRGRYVYIMIGDSMILSEPDDTHMTLFSPDERLLCLVRSIASAEGLFIWEGNV